MRYLPVPKELDRKTRRLVDTMFLINATKRKKGNSEFIRFFKKIVAQIEG